MLYCHTFRDGSPLIGLIKAKVPPVVNTMSGEKGGSSKSNLLELLIVPWTTCKCFKNKQQLMLIQYIHTVLKMNFKIIKQNDYEIKL